MSRPARYGGRTTGLTREPRLRPPPPRHESAEEAYERQRHGEPTPEEEAFYADFTRGDDEGPAPELKRMLDQVRTE